MTKIDESLSGLAGHACLRCSVAPLETAPLLVRLRTSSQPDELLSTAILGKRLKFRFLPTLEWASAPLRSAYEAWGAKQEEELRKAASKDPSAKEIGSPWPIRDTWGYIANAQAYEADFDCLYDWVIDNVLLAQLYAPKILSGISLTHNEVYLRVVSESIGLGLYANIKILAGSYIGEYTGRIEELHSVRENGYACSYVAPPYPLRMRVVINAKECGNLTRFINHSAHHPNVEWREVLAGALFHVIMVAAQDIQKDEQLLVDYGKQYWEKRSGEAEL